MKNRDYLWCCVWCHTRISRYNVTCADCQEGARWVRSRCTVRIPLGTLCVDCGQPATCRDHRSYREPNVVAFVCAGCNYRRGPARVGPPPDWRELREKDCERGGMYAGNQVRHRWEADWRERARFAESLRPW